MGLTWCRERVEQAQNSKSPVDRILVCCSNVIKPKSPYSHSQGKVVNDFVYKGMRSNNLGISPPVPIHAVPPRTRNRNSRTSDWHTCTLTVPDSEDPTKPPIPPPRKKRKTKINSMEVLNHKLPELHSPSYVIYSEALLNQNVDPAEANETDVLHPLGRTYNREKPSGYERFGKLSGRRIKTENGRVKNEGERKGEQKIKHVSTVSLPNYNELIKPSRKFSADVENGDDKTGNQSAGLKHPHRNSSTISLPGEGSNSILSSLSEATIHRLETYMKRCRSFGALKPQQLLEKLEEFNKAQRSASESSDSWSGLEDWDLGVIEHCDPENSGALLAPKSTLPPKNLRHSLPAQTKPEEPPSKPPTTTPEVDEQPTGRTPIVQRSISVIEGVPIEWFLDPSLRPPAIMPPPEPETKTPPPSPENEADTQKNEEQPPEEHSSLLNILRQYKDDEIGEPELDVNEIIDVIANADPLTFEEVDVNIPPETLNPFLPLKERSNSLTEEQTRLLHEERFKNRSPSMGFESSAHLLHQLQTNREAIEKEILLKPDELIKGLRRESLCESLPEDAFEAFVNKRKPSLRESLNDFLGFDDDVDGKKMDQVDDEKFPKASDGKKLNNGGREDARVEEGKEKEKRDEAAPSAPPPLPLNPPPIVINPPPKEEDSSPATHSLVKSDENPHVV